MINLSWAQSAKLLFAEAKDAFSIGNYTNAICKCDKALLKNKKLKEANFIAGLSCYNLKDTLKAISYFSKEIQINKTDYKSFLYRAKLNTKTYELSHHDLLLAEELQPTNFLIHLEKGNLNYHHLKYNDAIKDYLKAVSIRTSLDDAYYKLGFCKFYIHDTINACNYWNKVEELDDYKNYELIQNICNKQKQP